MLFLLITGCFEESMTRAEAVTALDEAVASAKAEAATTEVIELTTEFTLGEAVEEAAEELRAWVQSQIPCSTVTRDGATVTIDFGALDDACVYNGHTYAGLHSVTIARNEPGSVEVTHAWAGFTNGEVILDGGASVTWESETSSRHVVHEFTWTDDERTVEATGDRTQRLLDPEAGLAAGIGVDGERTWTGSGGTWTLDIEGVEMRGQDPVPQAGAYTLSNPDAKQAVLGFERLDEDTIAVTFDAGRWERVYEVTSTGE